MDDARSLSDFASVVSSGQAASVRTREFDFHATFLKLTGQSFE
jgi:ABC-2 type transport system ATP-binding protein